MSPDHGFTSRLIGKSPLARLSLLVFGGALALLALIKFSPLPPSPGDKRVEHKGQVSSAAKDAAVSTVNPFAAKSAVSEKIRPNPDNRTVSEKPLAHQGATEDAGSERYSDDGDHVHLEQMLAEEENYLTEEQLIESQEDYDAIQHELARIATEEEVMVGHDGDVTVEQDLTPEERSVLQTQEKEANYQFEESSNNAEEQAYAGYLNQMGGEHLDSYEAEIQYQEQKSLE
jgi:multidrug efflux pump subunit AcrA (membrane-fusion protein)